MRKIIHQSRQSLYNLASSGNESGEADDSGSFDVRSSVRGWFASTRRSSSRGRSVGIPIPIPVPLPPLPTIPPLNLKLLPDPLIGAESPAATPLAPWTIPIPPELIYLIIDRYLYDDTRTLARLCMTSRALVPYCRKNVFRLVKINIRERHRGDRPVQTDLFRAAVEENPELLNLIQDLQIHDQGPYVYQTLHAITDEEVSLCSVLTAKMTNLKRFELNSNMTWSRLPGPLQESLCILFRSPSITELSFHGVAIPINLLHLVKNLKLIDIRAEGVGPPVSHIHSSSLLASRVEVETLKIRDRNLFGSTVHRVLEENSPIILSELKLLEVCLPGKWINSIQRPLQYCRSLTCLRLFLGTAGGAPAGLDLSHLRTLKSLTLSTDITMMSVGPKPNPESVRRFGWLVGTLCTVMQPCIIEDLTLIIRTGSLDQGKLCDWDLIDVLFVEDGSWPHLRSLEIIWCTGSHLDIQHNRNDEFVAELPVLLPNLSDRSISKMRTTYSDTLYNFWTYS